MNAEQRKRIQAAQLEISKQAAIIEQVKVLSDESKWFIVRKNKKQREDKIA